MNALILLSALVGPCEGGQCAVTVETGAGISVDVQVEATHAEARRAPVRTRIARREAMPVRRWHPRAMRSRIARLREARPVRRVLGRRCR